MEPQQEHQEASQQVLETPVEKKNTISTPAAILTGAVLIALAIFFTFNRGQNVKNVAPQPQQQEQITEVPKNIAQLRDTDYVRGNRNANILVIEYSDSDCPFCARFHTTMDQVVKDSNGTVAWAYRHFPLMQLHPNAYTEALALECVGELGGNQAFQNYLDTVINVTLNPDPKSIQILTDYAVKEGVNENAFRTCVESEQVATKVDASINEANAIGAKGTPFNIIVNRKTGKQVIIPGAYPIEEVKAKIISLQ